jgi:hypothetical protein
MQHPLSCIVSRDLPHNTLSNTQLAVARTSATKCSAAQQRTHLTRLQLGGEHVCYRLLHVAIIRKPCMGSKQPISSSSQRQGAAGRAPPTHDSMGALSWLERVAFSTVETSVGTAQ